jgi:sugar/nucleoside kinase (ribokinase family)
VDACPKLRPVHEPSFDVVGVGSAIVDVISHGDDAFLERHGMTKGAMALLESDEAAERLYADLAPAVESSGGSCANTLVGVATLGARAAFIGQVRDDQLGRVFEHDIRAAGVTFRTPAKTEGLPTARCLIVVTPDAQRTLNTYLGISNQLGPDEIDSELVAAGSVLYCEGYLWDLPDAQKAILHAMETAKRAGRKVALTLSDPFCVDRHRDEFVELAEHHVDILFANELEILSLYEVDTFAEALDRVQGHCEIACLTRSEKGSVIATGGAVHQIPIHPVTEVVDTTGAGDLYAAGVLWGYTRGLAPSEYGAVGAMAASEVISHLGARPEAPLGEMAARLLA